MPEQPQCAETGRRFATAEAASASETRFREIQDACAAGQVPELHKGDVIYIGTELYLGHGRDDFRGGLAEVMEVRQEKSKAQPTPFIRVVQQLDTIHNWTLLASEQKELRQRHGKDWAHPDPDHRPEFNED
ncbi:MAG TPA: hypothetical protein VGQ12_01290 [Candidatus Angelobacter sp.]|jgi:hypothetical protein|nr:hypothetical protein [Candidatus Angelobacter sp.]